VEIQAKFVVLMVPAPPQRQNDQLGTGEEGKQKGKGHTLAL